MVDYTLNNTHYPKTEKVLEDLVALILYAYVFKRCTSSTSAISSG